MAALYAKELMLRGDVNRPLIVAPGGLVEQWHDELAMRFGIRAELLTRDLIAATLDGNPFAGHPLLIARMDQLARDEQLLDHLVASQWDLTVQDEAPDVGVLDWPGGAAHPQIRTGAAAFAVSRHLLLMTATPHAGSDENYQLFLALLDSDRFVPDLHSADTTGLMRRTVNEQLLTFDGKPLFPERIAETVPYQLSQPEHELYEAVTHDVRTEMNRADALKDSPRRHTAGFRVDRAPATPHPAGGHPPRGAARLGSPAAGASKRHRRLLRRRSRPDGRVRPSDRRRNRRRAHRARAGARPPRCFLPHDNTVVSAPCVSRATRINHQEAARQVNVMLGTPYTLSQMS
jgi:hypothetical protein